MPIRYQLIKLELQVFGWTSYKKIQRHTWLGQTQILPRELSFFTATAGVKKVFKATKVKSDLLKGFGVGGSDSLVNKDEQNI